MLIIHNQRIQAQIFESKGVTKFCILKKLIVRTKRYRKGNEKNHYKDRPKWISPAFEYKIMKIWFHSIEKWVFGKSEK